MNQSTNDNARDEITSVNYSDCKILTVSLFALHPTGTVLYETTKTRSRAVCCDPPTQSASLLALKTSAKSDVLGSCSTFGTIEASKASDPLYIIVGRPEARTKDYLRTKDWALEHPLPLRSVRSKRERSNPIQR